MSISLVSTPPAGPYLFSAHFSVRGEVVVVALHGELDLAEADCVVDHLTCATLLARTAVVVDLSDLAFLDLAGLEALDRGRRQVEAAGLAVTLVEPSRCAARVLELAASIDTGDVVEHPHFETVDGAVARHSATTRHLHAVPAGA